MKIKHKRRIEERFIEYKYSGINQLKDYPEKVFYILGLVLYFSFFKNFTPKRLDYRALKESKLFIVSFSPDTEWVNANIQIGLFGGPYRYLNTLYWSNNILVK